MVMKPSLRFFIFYIFFTNIAYSLSKEDSIIKASLYPYTIKGITYHPHTVAVGTKKEVLASWYGGYFHGRQTAMGELYDMHAYTAAHKTYPLGTKLKITNPLNKKSLLVRINDRGPFWNKREIDLSLAAAEFLETKEEGVSKVLLEVISIPNILKNINKIIVPNPVYNIGYTAMSYSVIKKETTESLFEIGVFQTKTEANLYLKKFKIYFPKAYLSKDNYQYKVNFLLSAKETLVIKRLKMLKKKGLLTGYGLCWSYE